MDKRTPIHPLIADLMGYILDDLPITNLREINERLQNGTGSHEAVQATLLKEAKQRNNILAAENANLRAIATQSPSIEAQKKIIDDLREQLARSKSRANMLEAMLDFAEEY